MAEQAGVAKAYPKGTLVHVRKGYEVHEGVVISAVNYGTPEQADWYIEFDCNHCECSHYLKQVQDGYPDAEILFMEPGADIDGDMPRPDLPYMHELELIDEVMAEEIIQDGLDIIKEDEQEFCCPFCDALLPHEGASCNACDNPGGGYRPMEREEC